MRRLLLPGIALAPGAIVVLLGLAMDLGLLPGAILVLRLQATTGVAAIVVGLALAGLAAAALALRARWTAEVRRARDGEREARVQAHRSFVRRLNHELKNPLTAIRAGLANLDRDSVPEGPARSSLGNVRGQVERLARLSGDLRKLADLEAVEVERAPVDLAETVREAVEMARDAPGRAEREVTVSIQKLPWPLSPVQGDRDLLLLAVYNLLDNALKYSAPDAAVEVRANENGAYATVEVADTGRGIATEDLPHVAEELYRGRGAEGIEGSGLGLALVDRVARLHRGDLAIRSREGQGTIATLRVPLA